LSGQGASGDWITPQWPAPANVRALITTRNGGVSTGAFASLNLGTGSGDDAAAVAENRARLRKWLPEDPLWLRQVHGIKIADADGSAGTVPEADASVARGINTVCVVMMADCLPVLLTDTAGTVVSAAHAGWRGLAAGVLEASVTAMNVEPATLMAFLGPCISGAVYEVGVDVYDAFCTADPAAMAAFAARPNGKWLANLPLLAQQRLLRAGVHGYNIFGGDMCTLSEPGRFFSYRRDGPSGRLAALIWRERAAAPRDA
jgi:YfiH family protein